MSGFLARTVARAIGREASLGPRPDYRFRNAPLFAREPPPPLAAPDSMQSIFGDDLPTAAVSRRSTGIEFSLEAQSLKGEVAGPGKSGRQAGPPDAPSVEWKEPAYHPRLPEGDAGQARDAFDKAGTLDDTRRGREALDDARRTLHALDDAALLMPLDAAGRWKAGQTPDASGRSEDEHATRIADRRTRSTGAFARSASANRDDTPPPEEPPTVVVHIGRIDVRAVHAPTATPQAPQKSRLQRPTLEAYLHSRERGRP